MLFINNILNKFRNTESRLARIKEINSELSEIRIIRDSIVDNHVDISKSMDSALNEDMINRDINFIKDLAKLKYRDRILSKELDILKSFKDVEEFDKNEGKIKAHKILKSLYRSGKLSLKTYNEADSQKTEKGQVKYADVIVINKDGELLLLKRSQWEDKYQGAWVIPGGHVDEGETYEDAAIRELREESGISLQNLKENEKIMPPNWTLGGKYQDDDASIEYYVLYLYNDVELLLDDAETRDYIWIKRDEIDNYPMVFNMQTNVKKVLGWDETPQVKIIRKAIEKGIIPIDRVSDIVKAMNEIKGGKSDDKTVEDIAKKHNVFVEFIEEQLKKGIKIEREHTDSVEKATEIAMDHLWEIKDYYDRLEKMEEAAKKDIEKAISDSSDMYIKGEINDDLYNDMNDIIEKAKKDTSKLRKIKKLVKRGGKVFLQTFYVKDSRTEEEEVITLIPLSMKEPLEKEFVEVGRYVEIVTSHKTSKGTIRNIVYDKSLGGDYYIILSNEEGKDVWCKFSAIKGIKEILRENITDLPNFYDPDEFSHVRSLGGSSDVKLVTYHGVCYVLKKERDRDTGKDQLNEEVLADDIYRVMGVKVPESRIIKDKIGKLYKISEYIYGKELTGVTDLERKSAVDVIKQNFVLDCLLANWDVVGEGEDNILISMKDSSVYRIDNGSAMRYRARGGKKGGEFGREVKELISMRNIELSSGRIFHDITQTEIEDQIREILRKEEDILDIIKNGSDNELFNIMKDRLNYLKDYIGFIPGKDDKVLREDMPSLVTQNYFDNGWDELVLEGNEGIKDAIKTHIIDVENLRMGIYMDEAEELGMSIEDYKQELQSCVEKLVSNCELFRATHTDPSSAAGGIDVLDAVFNKDGRFKSLFEVNNSDGSPAPEWRSKTENSYFGYKDEVNFDKEHRPIYGYFTSDSNGIINSKGEIPPPNNVEQYGDTSIKIKKEVAMRKATICFRDSLGQDRHIACTPFAKPHFTSFIFDLKTAREMLDYGKGKVYSRGSYVEAQYHNQLTIDDIESVHISTELYKYKYGDSPVVWNRVNNTINNMIKFAAKHGRSDIKIKVF